MDRAPLRAPQRDAGGSRPHRRRQGPSVLGRRRLSRRLPLQRDREAPRIPRRLHDRGGRHPRPRRDRDRERLRLRPLRGARSPPRDGIARSRSPTGNVGSSGSLSPGARSSENPPVLTLVVRCQGERLEFPYPERSVCLGSAGTNEVVAPFSGVSRTHAALQPTNAGLHVTDAGSKNGLWHGGKRVAECWLRPGDVVQIGKAFLSVEDAETSDVEPALELPPVDEVRADRAETGGTESVEASSRTGSLKDSALGLIRELESLGREPDPSDPRLASLLGSAAAVLGLRYAVLFRQEKAGRVLAEAAAGDVPGADALGALVSRREAARPGPAGAGIRLERNPRTRRGLLVSLDPSRPAPAWRDDLLAHVASRLLGLPRPSAPPVAEDDALLSRLVLPEGMVVGESDCFRSLLAQVAATVRSRMDVLLLGETGTGKELIARTIHASGPSPDGPFVAINCAAIPSELLEAELFGVHGRVATGVDPRPGRLQQADGGTLFLDEVGELTDPLQAKLLRFLQEREVLPLGAPSPRKVVLRVVAASNRDLPALVREGRFRADLFFRLAGLQFHLPPLRDRRADIPHLVAAFVRNAAREERKPIRGVSRKALDLLLRHDWPGNVRELANDVRRAVLLCPAQGLLQADHFGRVRWEVERSEQARSTSAAPVATVPINATPEAPSTDLLPAAADLDLSLRSHVDSTEREAIIRALDAAGGNITRAARILGLSRPGLRAKRRRLGIP
ncbi:MAG: FHA domain-containing protein [Acidobacteria bacterium]|nr:MAG: FHA domain-containing protein [Acidobacteriota bacterium]